LIVDTKALVFYSRLLINIPDPYLNLTNIYLAMIPEMRIFVRFFHNFEHIQKYDLREVDFLHFNQNVPQWSIKFTIPRISLLITIANGRQLSITKTIVIKKKRLAP
jgi:hypothetical protein